LPSTTISRDKFADGADVRVLGIETATWNASVAIIDEAVVLTEQRLPQSASHGTALFPLVADALRAADTTLEAIDLLAVSIGPGSFTGLRIGLSMAKGLALACGIPMVGVPTLEALAATAPLRAHPLWTVLDACKGEVNAAAFIRDPRGEMETIFPASVCTPHTLNQRLQAPSTLLGDAVDTYGAIFRSHWGDAIELVPAAEVPLSGAAVARLGAMRYAERGYDALSGLEPCYVRMSEAERSRITSV